MHELTGVCNQSSGDPPDVLVDATGVSGAPEVPVYHIGCSNGRQEPSSSFTSHVIEEFKDLDKLGQGFTSADPLGMN